MTNQKKENPEKLDIASADIAAERHQELVRLFPEARTEGGKIDFDRLKRALGEAVDAGKERYGLVWPGKADCFKTIQAPSLATLLPMPEESVNFDSTENLIIEGDNLEVLKLLQKSYLGKVKMIYIDPPYNTGSDFIYPDNYSESLDTYLEYTGQVDAEGKKFGTNTETDGRFHSKWLNMMYPRIYLARNLLRADGVIFVSIDDNESDNCLRLLKEVFGEENFLGQLCRRVKSGGGSAAHHFAIEHDYVIAFARDKASLGKLYVEHDPEYAKRYAEEDEIGKYFWDTMERSYTQTKPYKIEAPDGSMLEGRWFRSEGRFKADLASGEVRFLKKEDGTWSVQFKQRMPDGKKLRSLLSDNAFRSTHDEIDDLGLAGTFSFPKPTHLIRTLVESSTDDDSIVLDFFAGSGTTGHAVLAENFETGTHRRFILVQLPEPCNPRDKTGAAALELGLKTIADVTKERVRRVIHRLDNENQKLPLNSSGKADRGFRAFQLSESNFKAWDANASKDAQAVEKQLALNVDHLRAGRKAPDFLYEILLKSGFPLTSKVEDLKLAGKQVFGVAGGALLVCLERELTLDAIRAMADMKPERVVCLDEGFAGNDQLKTNAVQTFKTKGVVFRTV